MHSMNLLIVDDDPTSLKLLRAQLEAEGHAVFEAHDGVDALALLEHQRVDAVISDILMPRMDGYRLCYEIRKHARLHDLPIILCTSTYTSNGDQKLVLDVGADKYLKKPVSVETLVAALHEVIALPHAARQPKALQEVEVLKEYSERLVSKLEEKNTELQATQAELLGLLVAANQSRRELLSVVEDQNRAEVALRHANRAFATLSAANRSLVHATDEDELLQAICQVIVKQHGYLMAWVGYVQHDENKSVKVMASAGYEEGYLDTINVTWADTERGMGSTGRSIRSGTTQLCQDFANDPRKLPWRDAAQQRGYAASIALPLGNGEVFGVLTVYADEVNAFSPAEIDLLEEMAGDMAFGVRTLHIRHERNLALVKNQEQLAQLQDNLEDTVRAIATIVEMRDPYTSGHQVRVADLAEAIAKQMGLPDEQVHTIHLAGMLHDLGKIQIPAEILSKPGKITGIEYSLIKIHPQAGYDILKGINFPWPIAQMVLQHHERLDGSGYPQGLKGEAIMLEARILCVADVVEAMSSHRPYRPGLGIEVALAEITKQRGIYFDPSVVDACLAVFREQHYAFKS